MAEIIHPELSFKIKEAAIAVHSYFGPGFLEKVYENAMAYKLKKIGIKCEQQFPLKVYFEDNVVVGEYVADILVEEKIILELKAIQSLDKIHFAQLKNYLKATKLKLGILINFGKPVFDFERIVL